MPTSKEGETESGLKFGRLTIIGKERSSSGVLLRTCLCDCGNITAVKLNDLKNGNSRSCGCLNRELASARLFQDLRGQRFGRLVVIEEAERSPQNKVQWMCYCDCGESKVVLAGSLKSGSTKSCGCLRRDVRRIEYGQAAKNKLYGHYRRDAKKRGFEWQLSFERFIELAAEPCHYCGCEPSGISYTLGFNGDFIYNGLDRVVNDAGYFEENVVPCCGTCNLAKRGMTYKTFASWIQRAAKNMEANYANA